MSETEDSQPIFVRDPRVKWLALAVAVLTLMVVVAGFGILHLYTSGHQNRLADQRRTDDNLRQIACIGISQVNENDPKAKLTPLQRELIREYRAKYHCPPYSKHRARHPFGPLPSLKPGQSIGGTPTAVPPAAAAPVSTPSTRTDTIRPQNGHNPSPKPGHPVSDSRTPTPRSSSSTARPSSSTPAPPPPSHPLVQICPTPILLRCIKVG